MILCFRAQLGYESSDTFILSKNLVSVLVDIDIIDKKLVEDLENGRVIEVNPTLPFIFSPLGLIPKHDGGWRKIYHLFHPMGQSINNYIQDGIGKITYTKF